MGRYQITASTLADFAERKYGANWRDQPFDAAHQDTLGEMIFNERKNGNLKNTWTSLPLTAKGAYAKRTWADVRNEIAQREVGGGRSSTAPAAAIPSTPGRQAAAAPPPPAATGLPAKTSPAATAPVAPAAPAAPAATAGSPLDFTPDPKFAGTKQYTNKPDVDAGVKTIQAEAYSSGAQARQAVYERARLAQVPVDQDVIAEANRAYQVGYNNQIGNALNMMSPGDRNVMGPLLSPNATPAQRGAYGGPLKAAVDLGNPYAVMPAADAVRLLRETLPYQGRDRSYLGPARSEAIAKWAELKRVDPKYADRLLRDANKQGPVKGSEGPNPAARRAGNQFVAKDYETALQKMQTILPFLYRPTGGAPKPVSDLIAQFDNLSKLDPVFAQRLEKDARERMGGAAFSPGQGLGVGVVM
jgi:hypothetical protein